MNSKKSTDFDGNRIFDREGIHFEVNLWLMIVSFFKNLFDINRTIAQAFKTIY